MLALLCALSLVPTYEAVGAPLRYGWERVDNLNIFFREAGSEHATTLVLLHGYPASSIQYDKLMSQLASTLHVIAPDYPAFGFSDAPDRTEYRYTFDHISETVRHFLMAHGIHRYGLYMQDYGVPVGFRLMAGAPEEVAFIIVQNGVIHLDGFPAAQNPDGELRSHWRNRNAAVDARRAAYAAGLAYPTPGNWSEDDRVSPEVMLVMRDSVQRPGVAAARNDLWHDYGDNVAHYPQWQALLKRLARPVLVIWGSRDEYFTVPGAIAYLRDAPAAEVHIIDSTHFASMEDPDLVAPIVRAFAVRHALAAPLNGGSPGPRPTQR